MEPKYISIPELAKLLGLSRIAVYKKVKKGEIRAVRIGKNYAIPKRYADQIAGTRLSSEDRASIDEAIEKTMKEYGETIKKLGNE